MLKPVDASVPKHLRKGAISKSRDSDCAHAHDHERVRALRVIRTMVW